MASCHPEYARVQAAKRSHISTHRVFHGAADPLLPPKHGVATARAIPGAELRPIEGMGRELPLGAWPEVAEAIVANT